MTDARTDTSTRRDHLRLPDTPPRWPTVGIEERYPDDAAPLDVDGRRPAWARPPRDDLRLPDVTPQLAASSSQHRDDERWLQRQARRLLGRA